MIRTSAVLSQYTGVTERQTMTDNILWLQPNVALQWSAKNCINKKQTVYTVPANVCKNGETLTADASETVCGHTSPWCCQPVPCPSSCATAADQSQTQRACRTTTTSRRVDPSPEQSTTHDVDWWFNKQVMASWQNKQYDYQVHLANKIHVIKSWLQMHSGSKETR